MFIFSILKQGNRNQITSGEDRQILEIGARNPFQVNIFFFLFISHLITKFSKWKNVFILIRNKLLLLRLFIKGTSIETFSTEIVLIKRKPGLRGNYRSKKMIKEDEIPFYLEDRGLCS